MEVAVPRDFSVAKTLGGTRYDPKFDHLSAEAGHLASIRPAMASVFIPGKR